MKMQLLSKSVRSLGIGATVALVPLAATAGDFFADRYLDGYLNEPYGAQAGIESKAPMAQESFVNVPGDVRGTRGAEGPMRSDPFDDKPVGHDRDRYEHPQETVETPSIIPETMGVEQ